MILPPMLFPGLALSLALQPAARVAPPEGPATGSAAVDSESERRPVLLRVIATLPDPEASVALTDALRAAAAEKLGALGFRPDDASASSGDPSTSSRTLAIDVSRDQAVDAYLLRFRVDVPGHGTTRRHRVCERCGSDALLDALNSELGELQSVLRAEPRAVVPASATAVPPSADAVDPPRPQKHRRIGPLGISGVVGLGVGVALIIPGAVLAATPDKVDNTMEYDIIRTSTPGYVLIGVGAAVAITGAVLLGVDLGRRAKSRRTSHVRVGPQGLALRW